MIMKELTRSIGLSDLEYQVLASTYKLGKMICFEYDYSKYAGRELQELYNKGIFDLYKRGILYLEGETYCIRQDVRHIFNALKGSTLLMNAEHLQTDISTQCFYLSGGENVVVIRPGDRSEEYIKISEIDRNELIEYLTESGFILQELLGEELQTLYEWEAEEMGLSGPVHSLKELRQEQSVVSIFTFMNLKTASEMGCLAVAHNSLTDSLYLLEGQEFRSEPYSVANLLDVINTMIEVTV